VPFYLLKERKEEIAVTKIQELAILDVIIRSIPLQLGDACPFKKNHAIYQQIPKKI